MIESGRSNVVSVEHTTPTTHYPCEVNFMRDPAPATINSAIGMKRGLLCSIPSSDTRRLGQAPVDFSLDPGSLPDSVSCRCCWRSVSIGRLRDGDTGGNRFVGTGDGT